MHGMKNLKILTRFSCATVSCIQLVPPITASCFYSELLQGMKSELVARHPKPPTTPTPPKKIHDVETPVTSPSKAVRSNAISTDQSKCLLGPQRCALVGFLDSVATLTTECYCGKTICCGRTCVAKSLGSCTKTSSFLR